MMEFGMCGIPELPERVCVETRFVSREIARSQNLNFVDLGSNGNSHSFDISPRTTGTITPFTIWKPMVSSEVMTDNPNPMRDREMQTEINTNSIAIQCDLNQDKADLEFQKLLEPAANTSTSDNNFEAEKKRFQDFIKSKTNCYSNGKLECLLCGEIKPNAKTMESHMALHWGPQKLCFRCGLCFEHKLLWKKHNCALKRPKKPQYIKCPHYFCAATVISPMELYDHLNEHCDMHLHKCINCLKKFPTAGELRSHLKIYKKCSAKTINILPCNVYKIPAEDARYRKRVKIGRAQTGKRLVVKKFLSQMALKANSNRSRFCNICLRRCRSLNVYQLHMKRCLEMYRRRLKRERVTDAVNSLFMNGMSNGI